MMSFFSPDIIIEQVSVLTDNTASVPKYAVVSCTEKCVCVCFSMLMFELPSLVPVV